MTPADQLRRLLAAVSEAWAGDRVFRYAAMAAAVSLVVLLGELGHGAAPAGPASLLPPPGSLAAPAPALPGAPGAAPAAGLIAPERPLNGLTIAPDPKAQPDRFGTLDATRRRKETP